MIELSRIFIDSYDSIIETRNKVYRLALDLGMSIDVSTRFSTIISEIIRKVLNEQGKTTVKLTFSKSGGYYYSHVFISCHEDIYEKLKNKEWFKEVCFYNSDGVETYLEIKLKILDEKFIPNEAFLQAERDRLIQKSGTDMLKEIKRKNEELNKAINDLKTSSGMIQTEKMRALGDLTAGVAHELNNPMMGILNYIQYAIKHTDKEDRKYKPLVDAEREVNRCQSIIDNLLTFSRIKAEGEEEYQEEKLSALCDRIIDLYAYKIRSSDITVIRDFPKNEPSVSIKSNKIQQVILNFVNNAIFAMRDYEKRELTLSIIPFDDKVEVKVSDTGCGIDEETLDKIFEPFFTTKQTGQGTGLGLSVSQSIIEEHDGALSCQSQLEEGTVFTIDFPLIK